jgi:hypothetical protein
MKNDWSDVMLSVLLGDVMQSVVTSLTSERLEIIFDLEIS